MNNLESLATRIEKAEAGSRELDALIANQFSNEVESDDGDLWWGPYNEPPIRVPDFTSSLDAALTLVPEGWRWVMREASPNKINPNETGFFARLETRDFESVTWGKGSDWITDVVRGQDVFVWAATPALALTAASIRSLAAKEGR